MASSELEVIFNGVQQAHNFHPVYLGNTLNRYLTHKVFFDETSLQNLSVTRLQHGDLLQIH